MNPTEQQYKELCTCGNYTPYTTGDAICAPLQPIFSCLVCWGSLFQINATQRDTGALVDDIPTLIVTGGGTTRLEGLNRYLRGEFVCTAQK